MRRLLLITATIVFAAQPAWAGDSTGWNLTPLSLSLDGWTAALGGSASGAAYGAKQGGDIEGSGLTGSGLVAANLVHLFGNGWELGLNTDFLVWHDALSGDNYGNRVFEKGYLSLQTDYGRVELGQQDGAAYALSTTGPKVDDPVAIDDANVTFYRDPSTGQAFTNIFQIRTGVFATENYAKISFYSARLSGIEIGGSFTPYEARDGLPFISRGSDPQDHRTDLLEAVANYQGDIGPVSTEAYAGMAVAHGEERMTQQDDLLDWGVGTSLDYDLEAVKLSLGGGFRQSNGYSFDIDEAFRGGLTRSFRLSATAATGPWIFGIEYSEAVAGREANLPGLRQTGYEPSAGYVVNSNLQLTLGWQYLDFTRDAGVFYDGKRGVELRAAFLHMQFHV
ncbi:MAG TPA: porin [Rhizomicrobium sp.]